MPSGGEEGYVHIHAGIHGIGDFGASDRYWRNPAAYIARRLRPPPRAGVALAASNGQAASPVLRILDGAARAWGLR